MPPCSRHGLRCRHTGRSDSRRNTTFRCGYCECRPCVRLGVTQLCIVAGSWRHYDERSRVRVPPARRAGGEATLMSEERELLRETVAALVDKHASPAAVREAMASERGYDESLWKLLSERVGAAALVVPEELGGAGGDLADAAVVIEELGKALVPTPLLGTTLAELALLAADQADAEAIERLAEGTSIGTVVFDPGYVVNGDVADVVVAADGTRLTRWTTFTAHRVDTMDLTRRLARVEAKDSADIGADPGLAGIAAILLAAEQIGAAAKCLDLTVDYTKDRVQFGRPIGSFQALKHRMADLYVAVQS